MFDPFSLVSIVISVLALLLSLYRELQGPDISLLNEPMFKLTDRSLSVSGGYIPQWFALDEVSFVFANYGGKGGTILDMKIDFEPVEAFKGFFHDFLFYHQDLATTIKDGENHTMKFKPSIRTIDWKRFALMKILKENQSIEYSVDRAISEGRTNFQSFCSFLSKNTSLGKVSCIVSLTTGRLRTKVKEKRIFQDFSVKNEYDETIDLLLECLQNWDNLKPTKADIINEFFNVPRNLMSELRANADVLKNEVGEGNIAQSHMNTSIWDNLIRSRSYHDEIQWFFVDQEKDLRENLQELYKHIAGYNAKIQHFLYLGEGRTQNDFKNLNIERAKLYTELNMTLGALKEILSSQAG